MSKFFFASTYLQMSKVSIKTTQMDCKWVDISSVSMNNNIIPKIGVQNLIGN